MDPTPLSLLIICYVHCIIAKAYHSLGFVVLKYNDTPTTSGMQKGKNMNLFLNKVHQFCLIFQISSPILTTENLNQTVIMYNAAHSLPIEENLPMFVPLSPEPPILGKTDTNWNTSYFEYHFQFPGLSRKVFLRHPHKLPLFIRKWERVCIFFWGGGEGKPYLFLGQNHHQQLSMSARQFCSHHKSCPHCGSLWSLKEEACQYPGLVSTPLLRRPLPMLSA